MCQVDVKVYVHPDGRRETVETQHRCSRASGSKLCRDVQRRSFEATHVVEARPSSSAANEDRNSSNLMPESALSGSPRLVGRDVSKRSSNSSSLHRRSGVTAASRVSVPSSTSSPPITEVKPSSRSPPGSRRSHSGRSHSGTSSASPVPERQRMPYPPPPAPAPPPPPPEADRMVLQDGTAVYDRVPSMGIPRAAQNERVRSDIERQSSISSITAEVDDMPAPRTSTRPARPRVSFDDDVRPPPEDQGPSRAARPSRTSRNGESSSSGRRRESLSAEALRSEARRELRDEQHRRRRAEREEENRQSRSERDQPSRTERRQRTTREETPTTRNREGSDERRERHRAETAAALEGQDFIEAQRESEYQQMLRERQMARQRRESNERQQRYEDSLLPRSIITDIPSSSYQRDPGYYSARRYTGDVPTYYPPPSPLSPRSPTLPTLPQYFSARRDSASLRDLGDSVIAREQIRGANERMNDAVGTMTFNEMFVPEDDELSEELEEQERLERRASRRARRDERRQRRRDEMRWF